MLRHLRTARARPGGGLAAHARRPRGPALGRPGLAGGGGAPAAPDPDPRRAGAARPGGDDRRLAAPPLLRGSEPGAARGRPARPADDRQPAVVRPGDVGVHDVLPRPRHGRARPGGRDHAERSRPGPQVLDRPDAGDGPAHRDHSRPVRGRRHVRARRGRQRRRADCGRGGPAARDDGWVPPLHRRGRARGRGIARRRPAGVGAAEQTGHGERGGPRGRRARRRRRPRRHPRPAHRGRRPPRRRRGPRGRRAVAQPHPARGRWRLRLLPRPAPRRRLRGREPAPAVAAAPAGRAGPGAAPRRRSRLRVRAARRAVRPRRARRPGGRLLPPCRRRRRLHVRPRRGDPAARGGAGDRARDPGRAGPHEPGARPLGVAGEAPDRALRSRLAADPGDAGAIDRPGRHARAARLRPGRARRAVGGAVRARGHRDGPPHGDARAGDGAARLPAARTGALRLRGLGRQPGPAHRVRGALRTGRRVRRRARADRRHPDGGARPRLGRARALAARPRRPRPAVRHRSHRAGPRRRQRPPARRRAGLRRRHPPVPRGRERAAARRRRAERAVRALLLRLLPRVGTGARRMEPRRRDRSRPRPARRRRAHRGRFVRAHAVLALPLRRHRAAGGAPGGRPRDAGRRAGQRAGPRRRVVATGGDAHARRPTTTGTRPSPGCRPRPGSPPSTAARRCSPGATTTSPPAAFRSCRSGFPRCPAASLRRRTVCERCVPSVVGEAPEQCGCPVREDLLP